MRVLLTAVFIAFAAPVLTSAQALNPEIKRQVDEFLKTLGP